MRMLVMNKEIICVRGAGDLATGVIQKFARSGFRVYALEINQPTTIRRQVALSTAMSEGEVQIEDITAKRIPLSLTGLADCWRQGIVPIIEDREGESIKVVKPSAVVDAILAKKNLGTHRGMAPITIGLGPGFTAPEDVDIVVETMRGNQLGKMITKGSALSNTGRPGELGGQSALRVIHAPAAGVVKHLSRIGDYLEIDQSIFKIGETIVKAPFTGVLRGLISEGMWVPAGMKAADIDPRKLEKEEVFNISDKARSLGGAALEAYLYRKANYAKEEYI